MVDLSRLTVVSVREVWKHEADDFTRWMLENADVLAEVLGMELELTAAEHPVGGFSLDLIGREVATDNVVIVENQLNQTDHAHLGQIMTYAGGTDPQTIVWCAPAFRDEHRAALDWLNEHTDEDTRFFGVEVSVVRIDDSRPAPLFRLVAQPNDWAKQVHAETTAAPTARGTAYVAFWTKLLDRIRMEHPTWTSSTKGPKDSWIALPFGSSNIQYLFVFSQTGPRVELYFDGPDADANLAAFEAYARHEQQIIEAVGGPVTFDNLPNKKSCRIHVARGASWVDILEADDLDELMDWFISTMVRFREAMQRVKATVDSEKN